MLVGALAAFLTAKFTGNPMYGFLAGGLFGAVLAGIHGLVCLGFQGNQVVSGLALTILGTGLANYLGTPYVGQAAPGFKAVALPFLSKIPLLGPIFFITIPWSTRPTLSPPTVALFALYPLGSRAAVGR